jgi:hypothetical protein
MGAVKTSSFAPSAYKKVIWIWQLPIAPTPGDHRHLSRRGQSLSWLGLRHFARRRRIHAASRAEYPTHRNGNNGDPRRLDGLAVVTRVSSDAPTLSGY